MAPLRNATKWMALVIWLMCASPLMFLGGFWGLGFALRLYNRCIEPPISPERWALLIFVAWGWMIMYALVALFAILQALTELVLSAASALGI